MKTIGLILLDIGVLAFLIGSVFGLQNALAQGKPEPIYRLTPGLDKPVVFHHRK